MLEVKLEKELRDYRFSIEFSAKPGEILIFMGRNGSGKSTTLNLISGLLCPDAGAIRLNGDTLFDSRTGIDIPVEERRIGYVFQNPAIFPHLTVSENIAYGLRCRKIARATLKATVETWLDRMVISDIRNVRAGSLSGGQRQRVAFARALATGPSLLMLDEPFTALDASSILSVKEHIRDCVRETQIPCILVTHRISDATDLGSRICLFEEGRIVCTGEPDEIRARYGMNTHEECTCASGEGSGGRDRRLP
ncbi:MAG: ATP-binding cassette domain-containing protein [Methanoregulaceae archaeon]